MDQITGIKRHLFAGEKQRLGKLPSLLLFISPLIIAFSNVAAENETRGVDTHAITEQLTLAIVKLREGKMPSDLKQAQYCSAFEQYYTHLCQKHNVEENYNFPEPDRTDFYINAIKMSLLDQERHGGWAFRSQLSQEVRLELLKRLDQDDDPFLAFCALFPALKRGETEYAHSAYESLEANDPFLAEKVIVWSAEQIGQLDWLASPYLQVGQNGKVKHIATVARKSRTTNALLSLGWLAERLNDLAEAAATFRQVEDEELRIDALTTFYSRHLRDVDADGLPFQRHRDIMCARYFTKGLVRSSLADFTAPPRSGIVCLKSSRPLVAVGMRAGDVIVAVDGYRVETKLQYVFVRNLDHDNGRMNLIVWNGKDYVEIDAWIEGRKFGVPIETYSP